MIPSLNELLLRAQLLASGTKTVTNPQPLDHTLGQVLNQANELHARLTKPRTPQTDPKDPTKGAQTLLAPHGIDVQKLTAQVENLKMYETFKPIELPDTNVEAMIKNEVENAIISIITETNSNIFKQVQRRKIHATYDEWKTEKMMLLTALDDWEQKEKVVAGPCPLEAPLIQSQSGGSSENHRLSGHELLLAQELMLYNTGEKFDLLRRYTQLARENLKVGDLPQMWSLLEYMVKTVSPPSADEDVLQTRQKTPQFLKKACMHLEQCFRQQMFDAVNRSCHLIDSKTLRSVYEQVKHYVRLIWQPQYAALAAAAAAAKPPEALWPCVYFSLRSGDLPAAIQFFKDGGNLYPDLLELVQRLQLLDKDQLSDGQLLRKIKLKTSLILQYHKDCQQSNDPYKRVVYSILLGCNPQDPHNDIVRTIDDFLWLQLSVHRSAVHLNLEFLQLAMRNKYGQQFLADCSVTPIYFQLLVLSGHFEVAIEFLARKEATRSHAVHMAIALSELKMLSTANNRLASLLSGDPKECLNVVRLIISYAKTFELSNTQEALHYYYMLRKLKDTDGCNLMTKCIIDLLADNGCQWTLVEYIFGVSQSFDSSICCGGIYSQLPDVPCTKQALAALLACELVKRCDYQAAIRMYIIARDLEKAMSLVSSLLSGELHLPKGESSLRNLLNSLTNEVSVAMVGSQKQPRATSEETYSVLVLLMDFFASYHAGKLRLAKDILNNCQLLPNSDLEVNACLQRLKHLGRHVQQVMPNLLLAAMNIIHKEYEQLKRSPLQDHNMLQHLQGQAKAMINMAATMPYRIPRETNRQLLRLEIEMQY